MKTLADIGNKSRNVIIICFHIRYQLLTAGDKLGDNKPNNKENYQYKNDIYKN